MRISKDGKPFGFQKGHTISKGKNNPMYNVHRFGKNSPHWKSGIKINKGYVYIYKSNHPLAHKDKYIRRCILVMEKHLGRFLTPEEVVHHRGIKYPIHSIKNRQDDNIENLQLFDSNSAHRKFHCNTQKRNKLKQFIS